MALAVGIVAGGGGGYAVFASSNQAGTAILLILSAIFMLIGIQGTSLIRFSTGSNTVELERRRRTVEKAVKEIATKEPERAAGIIEGAQLALGSPPSWDNERLGYFIYEGTLAEAIRRMGYTVKETVTGSYYGLDLIVRDSENNIVGISTKYGYFTDNTPQYRRWIESVTGPAIDITPLLLVINYPVPPNIASWVAGMTRKAPVELITWQRPTDDQVLQASLARLLRRSPE